MQKYVFGPVPSRRLGISLGVDLIPHKVCSLNCVYCECGATTNLTATRKEYIPIDCIKKELSLFFENNSDPDYITLSGSGEPTLNTGFGEAIRFIKSLRPDVPLAVLTNGTLLSNKLVRADLLDADLVLPSLDAASNSVLERINRPAAGIDAEHCIQGLVDFRSEFKKQIWLETFILPGYNDTKQELDLLKEAFLKIQPDRIQINSLDRPGTIEGIRAATRSELEDIKKYWDLPHTEIVAPAVLRNKVASYSTNIEESILGTVRRRPCTVQDLSSVLGIHVNEVNKYLAVLEEKNEIRTTREKRGLFYKAVK